LSAYYNGTIVLAPVEITDDLLRRLGFTVKPKEYNDLAWVGTERMTHESDWYVDKQFILDYDYDAESWVITLGDYRNNLSVQLKYVHQLQDVYELTGRKLCNINDEPIR